MKCAGKYYVCCSPNVMVQVRRAEHERIRALRNEPLIEIPAQTAEWVWIDDPSCDEDEYVWDEAKGRFVIG